MESDVIEKMLLIRRLEEEVIARYPKQFDEGACPSQA